MRLALLFCAVRCVDIALPKIVLLNHRPEMSEIAEE